MKELYSFKIKRKIKEEVKYDKEDKNGKIVEAKKTKTKTVTNRVVFVKPNFGSIEAGEFFYGQQYNDFINAGYLTKSMLSKKIGDIGGNTSKLSDELLTKAFLDNLEAARTIEFYEGQDKLEEEQKDRLEEAKEKFTSTQKDINDFESFNRSQYSQTAESKAEQKLMEWFIFNFSYYEDKVKDKTDLFPLFVGDDFDQKREHYLLLCEDQEDIEGDINLKNKSIFDESFSRLAQIANLWYNKMGANQKELEESLKQVFPEEFESKKD